MRREERPPTHGFVLPDGTTTDRGWAEELLGSGDTRLPDAQAVEDAIARAMTLGPTRTEVTALYAPESYLDVVGEDPPTPTAV